MSWRGAALALALALGGAAPAHAQTLADLRSDLDAVRADLAQLQRELAPGDGTTISDPVPDTVLDRVAGLERSVQRLTALAEDLAFRIDRIVADGSNRIGDIEFRLAELEGSAPSDVPPSQPLGGTSAAPSPVDTGDTGNTTVVGEQAAFDTASAAHERGDWAEAEVALAGFAEAYPVGALTPRAHLLRADALERLGEPARAARAWLAAFDADPDGPSAPSALLGLGSALAVLDQPEEACIMLDELALRFPDTPEVSDAEGVRAEIGCP